MMQNHKQLGKNTFSGGSEVKKCASLIATFMLAVWVGAGAVVKAQERDYVLIFENTRSDEVQVFVYNNADFTYIVPCWTATLLPKETKKVPPDPFPGCGGYTSLKFVAFSIQRDIFGLIDEEESKYLYERRDLQPGWRIALN